MGTVVDGDALLPLRQSGARVDLNRYLTDRRGERRERQHGAAGREQRETIEAERSSHGRVGQVLVERIGFTPLKGGRHMTHDLADLTVDGPVGDRVFCLVDRSRGRVLRTVENPALLRACARLETGVLSVVLPGHTIEGVPSPSGETLKVDYWGRSAALQVCSGPWAEAYSEYLGYEVVLCRSVTAGEVVYGASVTVVTTASMRLLTQRLGREVGSERFRSTFLVDTGDSRAHLEDSWVGRELRVGGATVRVRGVVPRCAVIDLDPVTGRKDAPVMLQLAEYRLSQGEVNFGVDAVVTAAGRVRTGDQVEL
jgi:uncharacterized protein